jgi:hypothetical protein
MNGVSKIPCDIFENISSLFLIGRFELAVSTIDSKIRGLPPQQINTLTSSLSTESFWFKTATLASSGLYGADLVISIHQPKSLNTFLLSALSMSLIFFCVEGILNIFQSIKRDVDFSLPIFLPEIFMTGSGEIYGEEKRASEIFSVFEHGFNSVGNVNFFPTAERKSLHKNFLIVSQRSNT